MATGDLHRAGRVGVVGVVAWMARMRNGCKVSHVRALAPAQSSKTEGTWGPGPQARYEIETIGESRPGPQDGRGAIKQGGSTCQNGSRVFSKDGSSTS